MTYTSPQVEMLDALWARLAQSDALASCDFLRMDSESLPQEAADPRHRFENSIRIFPEEDNPNVYATSSSWEAQTVFRVVILGRMDTIDPRPLIEAVYLLWKALAPATRDLLSLSYVQNVEILEGAYGDISQKEPERWQGEIEWAYVGAVRITWLKGQSEMTT
jgi:hypothetical protein